MNTPVHPLSAEEAREELLEALWTAAEAGEAPGVEQLAQSLGGDPSRWHEAARSLVEDGALSEDRGRLTLDRAGAARAGEIVRRHRLAEVLYAGVVGVELGLADRVACRVEHVLDADAADAICTFLGHPGRCPHGREIPRGACCRSGSGPSLRRLADLPSGACAEVSLLLPDDAGALARLADLGLYQGARLEVRQRQPSLVVAVEQTVVALDRETAARVLVRELPRGPEWR